MRKSPEVEQDAFSIKAVRFPWEKSFPLVAIHAPETLVKQHPYYRFAKSGNVGAAFQLVLDAIDIATIDKLRQWVTRDAPVLISVHAEEQVGVNAIPAVLADVLGFMLDWEVERMVVQANVVNHTGANGFARLARQAFFSGEIDPNRAYVIVDDFVGQGGTIANLRGHVMQQGGRVLGATVLTGKPYSALLQPSTEQIEQLRSKHGELEEWWKERFGFGFEFLTGSEARYLINSETSGRIRARIEAELAAG